MFLSDDHLALIYRYRILTSRQFPIPVRVGRTAVSWSCQKYQEEDGPRRQSILERSIMLPTSQVWMDLSPAIRSRIILRRRGITQRPTVLARPSFLVALEFVHSILELRTQIYTVERSLVHLLVAVLAIPPQSVDGRRGSMLLQHNADGVCEPHRIVGHVGRKKEHLPFVDRDIAKLAFVDDLE